MPTYVAFRTPDVGLVHSSILGSPRDVVLLRQCGPCSGDGGKGQEELKNGRGRLNTKKVATRPDVRRDEARKDQRKMR